MAWERTVEWGTPFVSTDTFTDKIGTISEVNYADFNDSLKSLWDILYTGLKNKIDNSGDTMLPRVNKLKEMAEAFNGVGAILAGRYTGFEDYIVTNAFIGLNVSAYPDQKADHTVHASGLIIHKDDFIELCNIWNLHLEYVSTIQSTPVSGISCYLFSYSDNADRQYTLLHDVYSFNSLMSIPRADYTPEEMAAYIYEHNFITKAKDAETQYNVQAIMSSINSGHTDQTNYTLGSNSIAQASSYSVFGAYGSSVQSAGQPDSSTGGGDGDGDNESDPISVPPLPAFGAYECGMLTIYNPSLGDMMQLAEYLWDGENAWDDFWDGLEKKFTHPTDAIISLMLSYVAPGDSGNLKFIVGGKVFKDSNNNPVYVNAALDQFVEVDCGTLHLNEYWGNFMDYSPYTKIQLYLPYVGFVDINTDDFMGKDIGVKYHVDLLTGACQAYVSVIRDGVEYVLYTHNGNTAVQVPVTNGNYAQQYAALIGALAAVTLTVATAGTAAIASTGAATGGITSAADVGAAAKLASETGALAGAGKAAKAGLSAALVGTVMSGKSIAQRSGSAGSATPLFSLKKPYIIITRPHQSIPKDYNKWNGYPSNITRKLSTLSGYTVVESVHIENINCTGDEKDIIENLLTSGVIL